MNNKNILKGMINIAIFASIIFVIVGIFKGCLDSFDKSENNDKIYRCSVCHKEFTNQDDVHSIIWSDMCENCHNNYEFTNKAKEELKKYKERYGD